LTGSVALFTSSAELRGILFSSHWFVVSCLPAFLIGYLLPDFFIKDLHSAETWE